MQRYRELRASGKPSRFGVKRRKPKKGQNVGSEEALPGSRAAFYVLTLIFLGACVLLDNWGRATGLDENFQNDAVSTSILDDGTLGQILRELGLVERLPIDRAPSLMTSRPGKNSAGNNGKLKKGSFVFTKASGPGSLGKLVIAEVQPSNAGEIFDRDGDASDWIELWNPTEKRFDVTGWHLTDDPKNLGKWKFPELVIQPGERLMVFASGKDARDGGEFHTNFRLAKAEGYAALVRPDKQIVEQELRYALPPNRHGVSFDGTKINAQPSMFPTPGMVNGEPAEGFVCDVMCSHDSCLFDASLVVSLSCETPAARIRYTTDSSEPTVNHGHDYTGPLLVDKTSVIRAIAVVPQYLNSRELTRSYLCLSNLIEQSNEPAGFPTQWGETKADYAMDPRIAQRFSDAVRTAFRSLPIVSVVADQSRLFGDQGIYSNTFERGFEWEVPATVELMPFHKEPGFSAACGIRISGNESRHSAWKKHSLRLNFRGRYGLSALDYPLFDEPGKNRFSTLVLRSTDDSWVSDKESIRQNAQYIRDQWARETERAMGRLSARGRFVHVCLNGLYWGVYNLVERPDDEFLAHQLGGQADDYLTLRLKCERLVADEDGLRVWTELSKLADSDLSLPGKYEAISQRLEISEFIDYCLIHLYAGGEDWALVNGNNMRAYCGTHPDSKMRFLISDADSTFASGWNNDELDYVLWVKNLDDPKSFKDLFDGLIQSPGFRSEFLSRLKKWTKGDEALSPNASRQRYERLLNSIEPALMAEAARWGDVHTVQPYIPSGHWTKQKQRILNNWFLDRASLIQLRMTEYWAQ